MQFNNTFEYDLKVGQGKENLLSEILSDKTLEVKFDRYNNGRHFIETHKWLNNQKVGSGILASTAIYYAIAKSNSFILVERKLLMDIIADYYEENHYKGYKDQRGVWVIPNVYKSGGDKHRYYGILLEEEYLIKKLQEKRNENQQ